MNKVISKDYIINTDDILYAKKMYDNIIRVAFRNGSSVEFTFLSEVHRDLAWERIYEE